MSQPELLKSVVELLEQLDIGYMATGSTVSSLQGDPRSTHDIDIVVAVTAEDARRIAESFDPSKYYADSRAAAQAVERGGMFNVVDTVEGDKVDFWVLLDEPFDRSRFARRTTVAFLGLRLAVTAPEDTILSKLRWARLSGGSEKQVWDARRVYEVQAGVLDEEYLDEWATRLDVTDELAAIRAAAQGSTT